MDKEQNSKKYEEELLKAIKRHRWKRFGHIDWSVLSFCRATAYNYGLENLDSIRDALAENRIIAVNYMLDKWIESENPTLQIAAMRMVADDEDRKRLNQHDVDVTSGGQPFKPTIVVATEAGKELLEKLDNETD